MSSSNSVTVYALRVCARDGEIKQISGTHAAGVIAQEAQVYGEWPESTFLIERHTLKPADYADMDGAPECGLHENPDAWAQFALGRA